jgi:hypothetical protein
LHDNKKNSGLHQTIYTAQATKVQGWSLKLVIINSNDNKMTVETDMYRCFGFYW